MPSAVALGILLLTEKPTPNTDGSTYLRQFLQNKIRQHSTGKAIKCLQLLTLACCQYKPSSLKMASPQLSAKPFWQTHRAMVSSFAHFQHLPDSNAGHQLLLSSCTSCLQSQRLAGELQPTPSIHDLSLPGWEYRPNCGPY